MARIYLPLAWQESGVQSAVEKAMSDLEKLLEIVRDDVHGMNRVDALHMLKLRLLPLLEAGQAMAEHAPGMDFDRLAAAWDAALEKAMRK